MPPSTGTSQMLPRTNCLTRNRVLQLIVRSPRRRSRRGGYAGGRGAKGRSSSCPAWTTPQLDSGTSFQAPCEVAERLRDDEPRLVGELVRARGCRGTERAASSTAVREEERPRLALARVAERPDAARRRWSPRSSGSGTRRRARGPTSSIRPTARCDGAPAGRPRGRRSARGRRTPRSRSSPRSSGKSDGSTASSEVALDRRGSRGSRRCASTASCRGGTGGSSSAAPACPSRRGCGRRPAGERMCAGQLAQVAVVPGRLDAAGTAPASSSVAVPADAEPVAVRRRRRRAASAGSGRSASARACRAAPRGGPASPSRRASGTRPASGGTRCRSTRRARARAARCSRGSWRSRSATSRSARSWLKPAPDDDPQRREVRAVRRERVRGHLPAALAQRVRDVEDGEVVDVVASSLNANTGSSSPVVSSSNGPSSAISLGEPRRDRRARSPAPSR